MSPLVGEDGRLMTYAVIDNCTRTVVAGFHTEQSARKGLIELNNLRDVGADRLTYHNITDAMCPDWSKEIVGSYQKQCRQFAGDLNKGAAGLRRIANDLVAKAERLERHSAKWRELSERDSEPRSSGL